MSYDTIKARNQRSVIQRHHACAIAGCGELIPRHLLMCLAHWKLVPTPLKDTVMRAYHHGGASAYLKARKAAIESVTGGQP